MARKKTACKWYPGRFLASGSTEHKHHTICNFISQVWRTFQRKVSDLIVRLALWNLIPYCVADWLLEGLRHD